MGLGIEVEDDGAAAEVGQRHVVAVLVGEGEVGGGAACFDHAHETTAVSEEVDTERRDVTRLEALRETLVE
jgi:hypothetical protein